MIIGVMRSLGMCLMRRVCGFGLMNRGADYARGEFKIFGRCTVDSIDFFCMRCVKIWRLEKHKR